MTAPLIDGLQYANWSQKIFREMKAGGVNAVHVAITYHGNFRETMLAIDLLRCKLAFFGASHFDPRSDRCARIALFQGAPVDDRTGNAGGQCRRRCGPRMGSGRRGRRCCCRFCPAFRTVWAKPARWTGRATV